MGGGTREVVWTPAALDCVNEALAYIAQDSEQAAVRVLDAVEATAASLSTLSERGHIVPELEDRTIREVYVHRYRLIYQVSSVQVRILALVHGSMDFAGRLKNT